MSEAVKEALQSAIETKRRELAELEAALRKHESESALSGIKAKRRRRKTGFQQDSVPFLVRVVLKETGRAFGAADLADELKKRGKDVDSRIVASSLSRYIGTVFERTDDGMYILI